MNGVSQKMNEKYQQDMMANMLKQAEDMQVTIDSMTKMQSITVQMADVTHSMVTKMKSIVASVSCSMSPAQMSTFDDKPASCAPVEAKCPNLFEDDAPSEP